MHTVPMRPVNGHLAPVSIGPVDSRKLVILAHGRRRPQGTDRAVAGAAGRVSVGQRGRPDALRRQGALAARPRPQLSRGVGHQPAPRRAADRDRVAGRDRHRLGDGGAGAREQPDQAAHAALQHPAARRQELSLPAADDQRALSARARGAQRRGGLRRLLRRPVPAGQAGPPRDGALAQGVRHPILQRGDHRPARPSVPGVRHRPLRGAVRRGDLLRVQPTRWPVTNTRLLLEGRADELARAAARSDGRGRGRRSDSRRRRSIAMRCAPCRPWRSGSRRWRPRGWWSATCSA